jgi:hypothetical protein
MRWYRRNVNKYSAKNGDERVIVIFLLFKRNINGEVRWLEKAWIRQKIVQVSLGAYGSKLKWIDVKWTNEKDEFLEQL